MQPSSLIFVVIVAIWAAYLVQYWVRRREHLSTAQSVDRFSEALRVLDRRTVSPVRADGRRSVSMLTMVEEATGRPLLPHTAAPTAAAEGGAQRVAEQADGNVEHPTGDQPHAEPTPPVRVTRPAPAAGLSRRARLARGVVLLTCAAGVPVTAVLSLVGVLPWVSVAVAFAAVVGCVVALRLSVVRSQRRRSRSAALSRGSGLSRVLRSVSTGLARASHRATARLRRPRRSATAGVPSSASADDAPAESEAAGGSLGSRGRAAGSLVWHRIAIVVRAAAARVRRAIAPARSASPSTAVEASGDKAGSDAEITDSIPVGEPHAGAAAGSASAATEAGDAPSAAAERRPRIRPETPAEAAYRRAKEREEGTWSPVPVPRPTYLMKDKVVMPEPAVVVEPPAEPTRQIVEEPAELEHQQRRVVGG